MTEQGKSELQMERIVFFSDAVFAIAITLLIIEIKVPHLEENASSRDFSIALLKEIPKFIGFLFSFFVVGAYWVGHHQIYGHITSWNYGLVWRNVMFLAAIAFMPFATAFYSEYPTRFVPLFLYAANFSAAGFLETWQWRYAAKNRLIDETLSAATVRQHTWHYSILPLVGLTAILLGLITPLLAGFAFWLIPILQRVIRRRFAKTTENLEVTNNELTREN